MIRFRGDLAALMLLAAQGRLMEAQPADFSPDPALTVVMAGDGYPGPPATGGAITGIDAAEAEGAKVFHAGTALRGGALVANGGRVLNVTASGPSVRAARDAAYRAVDGIDFPTGFCRRDIGWREIAREG
jgi:phosphoribosylamine--glycine ligase